MAARQRTLVRSILVVGSLTFAAGLVALWFLFHSIPWQSQLGALFDDAQTVEIFRLVDGKPRRWVRFTNPSDWKTIPPLIRFQATFWRFSDEPIDTVVVQTIRDGERLGAFEVRNDGCIHLRKAVRWYRMPVGEGLQEEVHRLLDVHGKDLPTDEVEQPR